MFYDNIAVSLLIAGISMTCFAPFKNKTKKPSSTNQKSQDNWTSVLKLS